MDSSADSEMIESLNILRPPVKRSFRATDKEISFINHQPNKVLFISDPGTKRRKRTKFNNNTRRFVESSTSLILEKSTKAEIYGKLSIVSNTEIHHNNQDNIFKRDSKVKVPFKQKPLIKVIVIPNNINKRTFNQKEHNEVRNNLNKRHSSLDNSILTKNVYVVAPGKTKEKAYDLKPTDSAKEFEIKSYGNDSVDYLTNIGCIHNKDLNSFEESIMSSVNYGFNINPIKSEEENTQQVLFSHECKCCGCENDTEAKEHCKLSANFNKRPSEHYATKNVINFGKSGPREHGKNKVKIFGQLGLTDDDRYVLKCGATIDNKPIITDFERIGEKMSTTEFEKLETLKVVPTHDSYKPLIAKLTSLANASKDYEPPSLTLTLKKSKLYKKGRHRSPKNLDDSEKVLTINRYTHAHQSNELLQNEENEKQSDNPRENKDILKELKNKIMEANESQTPQLDNSTYTKQKSTKSNFTKPAPYSDNFSNMKAAQKQPKKTHGSANKACRDTYTDNLINGRIVKRAKQDAAQQSQMPCSPNAPNRRQSPNVTQDAIRKEYQELQLPHSNYYAYNRKQQRKYPNTHNEYYQDPNIPYAYNIINTRLSQRTGPDGYQNGNNGLQESYTSNATNVRPLDRTIYEQRENEQVPHSSNILKRRMIQRSTQEQRGNRDLQILYSDNLLETKPVDQNQFGNQEFQAPYFKTMFIPNQQQFMTQGQRGVQETQAPNLENMTNCRQQPYMSQDQRENQDSQIPYSNNLVNNSRQLQFMTRDVPVVQDTQAQENMHYSWQQQFMTQTQSEIQETPAHHLTNLHNSRQQQFMSHDERGKQEAPSPYLESLIDSRQQQFMSQDQRGKQESHTPYSENFIDSRQQHFMTQDQRGIQEPKTQYYENVTNFKHQPFMTQDHRVTQEPQAPYVENAHNLGQQYVTPDQIRNEFQIPYADKLQHKIYQEHRGYQEFQIPYSDKNNYQWGSKVVQVPYVDNVVNIRQSEKTNQNNSSYVPKVNIQKVDRDNTDKNRVHHSIATKCQETQKTTPGKLSRYIDTRDRHIFLTENNEESASSGENVLPKQNLLMCDCKESNVIISGNETSNTAEELVSTCSSPVVIISVYPNDVNEKEEIKGYTSKYYPLSQKSVSKTNAYDLENSDRKDNNKRTKSAVVKKIKPRLRSPSPSPRRRKPDKVVETRMLRTDTRTKSPTQSKLLTKPKEPKPKTNTKLFAETNKLKSTVNNQQRKTKRTRSCDKGVNTERASAVGNEHDQLDELMKIQINKVPKTEISKISVNIDSENEFYDVSFHQDKNITDLSVRKTVKDSSAQYTDIHKTSDSLENFLPLAQDFSDDTAVQKYNSMEYFPNDETNSLIGQITGIKARDSLQIKHRPEDEKIEIFTQTETLLKRNSVSNDDLDFFAPIKHFTGDDCKLGDPLERDREIRKLLGVDARLVHSPKDRQKSFFTQESGVQHCFNTNMSCKSARIADVSGIDSVSSGSHRNLHKRLSKPKYKKLAKIKHHIEVISSGELNQDNSCLEVPICIMPHESGKKPIKIKSKRHSHRPCVLLHSVSSCSCDRNNSGAKCKRKKSVRKEVDKIHFSDSEPCPEPVYQYPESILRCPEPKPRSITPKPKPRCPRPTPRSPETKMQYSTQRAQTPEQKPRSSDQRRSSLSKSRSPEPKPRYLDKSRDDIEQFYPACDETTCEARRELEQETKPYTKPTITLTRCCSKTSPTLERTSLYQQLILNRNIQVFLQVEQFCKQKPICLSRKQYDKVKKTIQRTISKSSKKPKDSTNGCEPANSICSVGEIKSMPPPPAPPPIPCARSQLSNSCGRIASICKKSLMKLGSARRLFGGEEQQCNTMLVYSQDAGNDPKEQSKVNTRHSVTSMQVTYANVTYLKEVTLSSASMEGSSAASSINLRQIDSIETLFREHRRTFTPNLGTSIFSGVTEAPSSTCVKVLELQDRPKRPFFKRLMSCLVMRSDKTALKPNFSPVQREHAASMMNSSLDSYHLSSSLGAIEMSSSIYDTSVSFYTNHSVRPEIYKVKRGFFSSVRGFLNSRKN